MLNTELILTLTFNVLGGLALFIYGMHIMSKGMAEALGEHMRTLISKATRNRFSGILLGTLIGFAIQSSASTVLYIGFINAGLMRLSQAIAPMLGANIGTTLSIQLISFKLSDYCLVAVAIGMLIFLTSRSPRLKQGGLSLLGFGLLFLGMTLMSDAIRPHREFFEPWLARINGNTASGLLLGTVAAALITGIIQSSGAVIGMGFALISAGAITDLSGMYPILIGANIGTCVTGLLGSIGTTIDARRIAIGHLLFNLFSTALAAAAAPLFYKYIPLTSTDLIHQAANANTIKMLVTGLMILPFVPLYSKLLTKIIRSKISQPESSFLETALLDRPEQAIYASLRELQRSARICAKSLRLAAEEFIEHDPSRWASIQVNEHSINEIKAAMRTYLTKLTGHYLSKRQAIMIEHIDRCMSDLERIGDHIENLAQIAQRQRALPAARFIPEAIEDWLSVHRATEKLLKQVIDSLDPETPDFQSIAKQVIELHEAAMETAIKAQQAHFQRLEEKNVTPMAGILFNDYLSNFRRLANHIRNIALAEQEPQFWLKREKLQKVMSSQAPGYAIPHPIDPKDYLERLRSDSMR